MYINRVVLRASPFKSRQGLRLHRAEAAIRLDAFRLKHERQHRSVMSEEEEVEEEGIHYVEKTLFYWFSVREMANVLRDNLASIKTPYCPLRCEDAKRLAGVSATMSHILAPVIPSQLLLRASNTVCTHQSCM